MKRKKYNDYYKKKIELCTKLVEMKKKHINTHDVERVANDIALPHPVAIRAWNNFVQYSGDVDKRRKYSKYVMVYGVKVKEKPYTKARQVTKSEAAKITLEFMQPKTSATMLSKKYSVSIHQIYAWIHELEISGKLLGDRVLNPEKYSKPNLLTAIAYKKNPYSSSARVLSLTQEQKLNYTRVVDVLKEYLTAIAQEETDVRIS